MKKHKFRAHKKLIQPDINKKPKIYKIGSNSKFD